MDESTRSALTSRRISEFKTHPVRESQESRRQRALSEQKRKRAERIESSRNIDLFANLSLESPPIVANDSIESEDEDEDHQKVLIANQGISQYASLLESSTGLPTSFGSTSRIHGTRSTTSHNPETRHPPKNKFKKNTSSSLEKRSAFLANTIMYAELLEMNLDSLISGMASGSEDGLPIDLDRAWTAMAPVPKGKRCLAASYQSLSSQNDLDHPRSKTLLHSRLKGKPFLTFPSPLPPDSILDCILDANWRQNGILHIVDIIRWRGSDFAGGETEFRFWWRDARISELKMLPVPQPPRLPIGLGPSETSPRFSYPITFVPTPYFSSPISLQMFLSVIIPAARSSRQLTVQVPDLPMIPYANMNTAGGMDLDSPAEVPVEDWRVDEFGRSDRKVMQEYHHAQNSRLSISGDISSRSEIASIVSDGILLYVSASSYDPGESPLACWIPADSSTVHADIQEQVPNTFGDVSRVSRLDIFEKLLYRRLSTSHSSE